MERGSVLRSGSIRPMRVASGRSAGRPRTLLRFLALRHRAKRPGAQSDPAASTDRQPVPARPALAGRRQRGRGRSVEAAAGTSAKGTPIGQGIEGNSAPAQVVPQDQRRHGEVGIYRHLLGRSQPVVEIHWYGHRVSVVDGYRSWFHSHLSLF